MKDQSPEQRDAMQARLREIVDSPSSINEIQIEPGTLEDYKHLSHHHYKDGRPGAVTSVLRMTLNEPTVVGRYLARQQVRQVVGVLVCSLPHLACRMRDVATQGRYMRLGRRDGAMLLNREVRTISRVVIDPRLRGMGLAVRLVRWALKNCETRLRYTEALAAMGRVCPFFEQAGMIRYNRPPRNEQSRLMDALDHAGIELRALASSRAVADRLEQLTGIQRAWLERELRRCRGGWSSKVREARKLQTMSLDDLLLAAGRQLISQPVYYLHQHGRNP